MIVLYILGGLIGLIIVFLLLKFIQFYFGKKRVHAEYSNRYKDKVKDLGYVKKLCITPIVDYFSVDQSYQTEAGVSYMIETEDTVILLDVGFNAQKEHPSPLLNNMEKMGKSLKNIDILFFSHLHLDHVGGMLEQRHNQFSFSAGYTPLPDVPVYAPDELTPSDNNPGKKADVLTMPTKIANGTASTGAVTRFFLSGQTSEHSLAINVQGKGLVIVVGCGHQTIETILEMAKENFDEPVYAIVGGLHFPVKKGRIMIGPINLQGIAATENNPFSGITQSNLDNAFLAIEKAGVKRIVLSAHDSSDYAIEQFEKKFGQKFEILLVGKKIDF
ncbi:MAG: MBL fold metallo-hydrolase [Bacteroidota bacterium]|nr:MBL fold metallo-hydrolase [Bacteroidota bacterium]